MTFLWWNIVKTLIRNIRERPAHSGPGRGTSSCPPARCTVRRTWGGGANWSKPPPKWISRKTFGAAQHQFTSIKKMHTLDCLDRQPFFGGERTCAAGLWIRSAIKQRRNGQIARDLVPPSKIMRITCLLSTAACQFPAALPDALPTSVAFTYPPSHMMKSKYRPLFESKTHHFCRSITPESVYPQKRMHVY